MKHRPRKDENAKNEPEYVASEDEGHHPETLRKIEQAEATYPMDIVYQVDSLFYRIRDMVIIPHTIKDAPHKVVAYLEYVGFLLKAKVYRFTYHHTKKMQLALSSMRLRGNADL